MTQVRDIKKIYGQTLTETRERERKKRKRFKLAPSTLGGLNNSVTGETLLMSVASRLSSTDKKNFYDFQVE